MQFFRFGVAFHFELTSVGGRDDDIQHLNLAEPFEHAARTEAGGFLFIEFFQGDVQAVGEEAEEDVSFNAGVQLVEDGPQAEVAFEVAEAFFDPDEVDVVAPEDGGVFSGEVAAQEVLTFVAAGRFEFLFINGDAESFGGDGLVGCGEVEDDEAVGVASGFLFGRSDGEQKLVTGEGGTRLQFA